MKRIFWKKISIAVAVGLILMPVFVAQASFQDEEKSQNNSVSATSLDAEVTVGEDDWQNPETAKNLLPGETVTRSAEIKNVGGLDFQYKLSFEKISGDDDLCSALQLKAKQNGDSVYTGKLNDFKYNVGHLNLGDEDNWTFEIILPIDAEKSLENLDCNFSFKYIAWQKTFLIPTQGWVDEEIIDNNNVHSGDWANSGDIVINEFIPNPVGDDNNKIVDAECINAGECGEWVELYNKGNQDIDVNGWYLYDNNDDHELEITASNADNNSNTSDGGETIVPAGGFLVVYRNGDGDFALNNSKADAVRLFDGEISGGANLIDEHSYDGRDHNILPTTPNNNNSNNYSGGSGDSIPEGKSFVRYPDGADNWIDPVPTPGDKNDSSNSLKKFQDYYRPRCFDKSGKPICEEKFMETIGLLATEEKKQENKTEKEKMESSSQKNENNQNKNNELKKVENSILRLQKIKVKVPFNNVTKSPNGKTGSETFKIKLDFQKRKKTEVTDDKKKETPKVVSEPKSVGVAEKLNSEKIKSDNKEDNEVVKKTIKKKTLTKKSEAEQDKKGKKEKEIKKEKAVKTENTEIKSANEEEKIPENIKEKKELNSKKNDDKVTLKKSKKDVIKDKTKGKSKVEKEKVIKKKEATEIKDNKEETKKKEIKIIEKKIKKEKVENNEPKKSEKKKKEIEKEIEKEAEKKNEKNLKKDTAKSSPANEE